jgi:hypothetical protein
MDTRLLILIGAAAVLLLALVYLIETLAVSRRAKKREEETSETPAMLALPAAGDSSPSTLRTPLVLGDWTPPENRPESRPIAPVTEIAPWTVHTFPRADPHPVAPPEPPKPAPPATVAVVERALAGDYAPPPDELTGSVSLDSVLASLELRAAQARARTVDAPQELLLPEHLLRPVALPATEAVPVAAPVPVAPPAPVPVAPPAPVPVARPAAASSPIAGSPTDAAPAPASPAVPDAPARPAAIAHPVPEAVVAAQTEQGARRPTASAPETPRDYVMVAPVELVFDDSGPRVGIRSGTRTYLEFQRIASVLFDGLARSRPNH